MFPCWCVFFSATGLPIGLKLSFHNFVLQGVFLRDLRAKQHRSVTHSRTPAGSRTVLRSPQRFLRERSLYRQKLFYTQAKTGDKSLVSCQRSALFPPSRAALQRQKPLTNSTALQSKRSARRSQPLSRAPAAPGALARSHASHGRADF